MGSYALYISYQNKERCLSAFEKPLAVFKQLEKEGLKPAFMLKKHATPMMGYVEDFASDDSGFLNECLLPFERPC